MTVQSRLPVRCAMPAVLCIGTSVLLAACAGNPPRATVMSPAANPVLTAATIDPPPAAAAATEAAMREGQTAAKPCLAQIDDDLVEFLDCVRVRAGLAQGRAPGAAPSPPSGLSSGRRLGALAWGWYAAWIHDAYAVPGAEAATLNLMRELLPLQEQLKVSDAQICAVTEADCALVADARRDTLERLAPATR